MTVPDSRPASAEDSGDEQDPLADDPFAGLTGLDVIDGELVPRGGRRRRRR